MRFNRIIAVAACCCAFSAPLFAQVVQDLGTSGVANNGTLQGSASLTNDAQYGSGAVLLPPGDDNVVTLDQPVTDLDMASSYTFMTWFKQDVAGQKGLIVLGNCCDGPTPNQNREGYTMTITSSPSIRFWGGSTANDSNHNTYTPTIAAINDGDWHHAAIRVQPGVVDMFFDGVLVSTNNASNIPTSPSLATANTSHGTFVPKVGGDGITYGSTATTVVDEVRVYGAALSNDDVVAAMNNTGPAPDRLYYTFDDDSAVEPDGILNVYVTKTYSDGAELDVDVNITCNGGLPLSQDFTIEGGSSGVTFTVTNIQEGVTDCTVTETAGPDNYIPEYNLGAGCTFENVTSGARSCAITNQPAPASYTVNMSWDVTGDDVPEFDEIPVTISCDAEITGGSYDSDDDVWYIETDLGDGDSETVEVLIGAGGAECEATADDAIETNSGALIENGCGPTDLNAGEQESCEIVVTLFFEGIPTLSQYGMALLALLLLSLGFVGIRRIG